MTTLHVAAVAARTVAQLITLVRCSKTLQSLPAALLLCSLLFAGSAQAQTTGLVPKGGSESFAASSHYAVAWNPVDVNITWRITTATNVFVADQTTTNGWSVWVRDSDQYIDPDPCVQGDEIYQSSTATFTVAAPTGATIANGYKVSWTKKSKSAYSGPGGTVFYPERTYGGQFNVVTGITTVPAAPTNLQAIATNQQVNSYVTLTWTKSPGTVLYNIKRLDPATGNYTTLASKNIGTSYVDRNVNRSTTYTYLVTAVNAYGESGNSNIASVTLTPNPQVPQGGRNSFPSFPSGWTEAPAHSTSVSNPQIQQWYWSWDIVNPAGSVVADNEQPNGWSVTITETTVTWVDACGNQQTRHDGNFTVRAPLGTPIGIKYKVRAAGKKFGGTFPPYVLIDTRTFSAHFDVIPAKLYRLNKGIHYILTTTITEQESLVAAGWTSQGIIGRVYGNAGDASGSIPLYRMYLASTGNHNYAVSTTQRDNLINAGWQYEGITGYIFSSTAAGRIPFYRAYNSSTSQHLFTTNATEYNGLVSPWTKEGIWGYVLSP